jgi:hypothetical protein
MKRTNEIKPATNLIFDQLRSLMLILLTMVVTTTFFADSFDFSELADNSELSELPETGQDMEEDEKSNEKEHFVFELASVSIDAQLSLALCSKIQNWKDIHMEIPDLPPELI